MTEYLYTLEKSHVPGRKLLYVHEKRPDADGFNPCGRFVGVYNEWEKAQMKKDFPGIKELKLKTER